MADHTARPRVSLALQGGGAHGAFTWGVLDRLLEDDGIEVVATCGTSAGAMNGVALTYGLARGGPQEARRTLAKFWTTVSERAKFSPLQPTPLDRAISVGDMNFSPGWLMWDAVSRAVSPYLANPTNYNPLAEVLDEVIDFSWLRGHHRTPLFVCATNVKSGKIRVFDCGEISAKAVLASACLPFLYQAIEIDGEYYWDGGFMGNPPIYPLIYHADCEDVLIVQINPIEVEEVPTSAPEIVDRMNELSFNSSLMREMRAIAFVKKLLAEERVPHGRYKDLHIHTIEAEAAMRQLGYSSKLNADATFLDWLFKLGRERAQLFLEQ
ncbi:MAG: patatin-like phospholipase family protein, partial [Geminicoccaceae bacterium]